MSTKREKRNMAETEHKRAGPAPLDRLIIGSRGQKVKDEIQMAWSAGSRLRSLPMRFTRAELEACVGRSVPDLAGKGMRLLFVGINPGLWTAATQTHFAYPGNRFYPALHRSRITPELVDVKVPMSDEVRRDLIRKGVGITNFVNRATARADELEKAEIIEGAKRLVEFVDRWQPRVVAILGITAYRIAFADRKAKRGLQTSRIGQAEIHVLGNPSGLNAHETVDSLAVAFSDVARRSGLETA